MEWFQFLQVVCVPAFGWLFYRYNELKNELHRFQIEVAKGYATQESIRRLETKIDDLRDLIIKGVNK